MFVPQEILRHKIFNTCMKKTVFTLLALVVAIGAFAQGTFGIIAGPDIANMTTRTGGAKSNSNAIIGLAAGISATLPLVPDFYLQPSLLYEGKGQTQNVQGYQNKTRLNYLVLPVDFVYEPEMQGATGSWMIGIGPYLAYGFSAKADEGVAGTVDLFKQQSLKRMDAGAHIRLGYIMNSGFNIGLESELGIMNLATHGDSKNSVRNTSFAFTVGYRFPR